MYYSWHYGFSSKVFLKSQVDVSGHNLVWLDVCEGQLRISYEGFGLFLNANWRLLGGLCSVRLGVQIYRYDDPAVQTVTMQKKYSGEGVEWRDHAPNHVD